MNEATTTITPTQTPKTSKAKAKPSANGDAKGLGVPQVRILKALKKAGKPVPRSRINELCAQAGFATAKKFSAWMADPLGQVDDKARKQAEKKSGNKSLISLGYVKMIPAIAGPDEDVHVPTMYSITAPGKKALEKAS